MQKTMGQVSAQGKAIASNDAYLLGSHQLQLLPATVCLLSPELPCLDGLALTCSTGALHSAQEQGT